MPKYLFFYLFLFSISFISIINNVKAQPATIVPLGTFGSDPYDKVANIDEYFITTSKTKIEDRSFVGTEFGDIVSTNILDIIKLENNQLKLIEQVNLSDAIREKFGPDSPYRHRYYRVNNIYSSNNFFIILTGSYLVSGVIENGKLSLKSKILIPSYSENPQIEIGENGKLYAFTLSYNPFPNIVATISIDTIIINNNGEFSSPSTHKIELNEGEYVRSIIPFYANNKLFLTSELNSRAAIYQISLNSDEIPMNNTELEFEEAKDQYHALYVKEDTVYLADNLDNLQIATLIDDKLVLSKEITNSFHIDKFIPFKNKLITRGFLGDIAVFDIDNSEFETSFSIDSGTINDAVIYNDTLTFTKGNDGIETIDLSNLTEINSIATFDQSATIKDLTIHNNYLINATANNNLYVWNLESKKLSTSHNSHSKGLAAVESIGNNLIMLDSQGIIKTQFDNIYNREVLVEVNKDSQYSQIVPTEHGYVSILAGRIYAFNNSGELLDTVTLFNNNFRGMQKASIHKNHLFLPIYSSNSEILIFNIENLSQIHQVNRISFEEDVYAQRLCNTIFYNDFMYTCNSVNYSLVLGIYDVSDFNNIKQVKQMSLKDVFGDVIIQIYDNYMAIYGKTGVLYDLKDPTNPILISENKLVGSGSPGSSGPTTLSFSIDQNILYVVTGHSAGHIQKNQINLAPNNQDIFKIIIEDTVSDINLPKIDNETDNISYEIKQMPSTGSLVLDDNQLTFTPETNSITSEIAILIAEDPHGNFTEFRVNYEITPVNDAPEFIVETLIVDEDNTLEYQIIAEDSDNDELSFSITQNPVNGQTDITDSGLLTYIPNENFFGEDSIIITVTDTEGASTSQEYLINVNSINDVPELKIVPLSINEDSQLDITIEATDPENNSLEFELNKQPSNGAASITKAGQLTYIPSPNFFGQDEIIISVRDEFGGLSTEHYSIDIESINDSPTILKKELAINEDGTLTTQIVANDIDSTSIELSIEDETKYGIVSITKDGVFTYTPYENYFGQDFVVIAAVDSDGARTTVEFEISITPVDDIPTISKTKFSTDEDTAFSVLLEVSDLDTQDYSFHLIEGSDPQGELVLSDSGNLRYEPNDNFNGEIQVNFKITDNESKSHNFILTIVVNPINDEPVIALKNHTVDFEGYISSNLTTNDVDGEKLIYTLINNASNGTLLLSKNGAYSYTSDKKYSGNDSFTYEVTDGTHTLSGKVTFTVKENPNPSSGGTLLYLLLLMTILYSSKLHFNYRGH